MRWLYVWQCLLWIDNADTDNDTIFDTRLQVHCKGVQNNASPSPMASLCPIATTQCTTSQCWTGAKVNSRHNCKHQFRSCELIRLAPMGDESRYRINWIAVLGEASVSILNRELMKGCDRSMWSGALNFIWFHIDVRYRSVKGFIIYRGRHQLMKD